MKFFGEERSLAEVQAMLKLLGVRVKAQTVAAGGNALLARGGREFRLSAVVKGEPFCVVQKPSFDDALAQLLPHIERGVRSHGVLD